MIDDALWAEEHGLQGRAYFNTRGLTEGPYMEGDQWIRAACKDFQERRIASVLDDRLFPVDYPMTEPMFYLGWYNENVCGPMSRSDFRFARGAVAYHLHSFAAWTVRSTNQKWAGPLLAHGAAATMGSVWEPYLDGQPYLDVFANRLVRGYTFAESAYMSQRVLAWMSVFLGDPLYRPFLKPVRTPVTPEPPPRPAK
jgi:uncharacterized protein (TIGR03790 family)